MGSFSFPKNEKILNRADFVKLNRLGKRLYTQHFTLITKKNGQGVTRLGVTVSKKSGTAVKRNRIKRLIRVVFRLNKDHYPPGHDIVILAKKANGHLDFWKTKEEIGIVFGK